MKTLRLSEKVQTAATHSKKKNSVDSPLDLNDPTWTAHIDEGYVRNSIKLNVKGENIMLLCQ